MREDLFPNPSASIPTISSASSSRPEVWSPFGGGPHGCAGKDLAIVIMKAALATIVRKTELKLAQDEVRPVRVAYYYEPNKGLLVKLERRL